MEDEYKYVSSGYEPPSAERNKTLRDGQIMASPDECEGEDRETHSERDEAYPRRTADEGVGSTNCLAACVRIEKEHLTHIQA